MVTDSGKYMKKIVTLPDKIEEPWNEPFRYSGHIHYSSGREREKTPGEETNRIGIACRIRRAHEQTNEVR